MVRIFRRKAIATSPAIETHGLTKRYGPILAVDHLDLVVNTGEIFGFLGPNGAGKTTTMRMLLGLVKPTSGTAQVLGQDLGTHLPAILADTGSLIESPTFYPFLTGHENLEVVADITGAPHERIPEMLELVDLTGAQNRAAKTYSLGMKQRLGVASALINRPHLLLLDEPANGLDPAGIVDMRNLMLRLKGEGHTVFISSHVLHEIEQICDRIAILQSGRIVVQGPVQQLLRSEGRIEIRVARPTDARAALAEVPWIRGVEEGDGYLYVDAPLDRSADVNEVLAGKGIFASEIRPHEVSLERYFLEVTQEKTA